MPLMFGILMSVMTTSNRADSSFLFAASPEVTVSTLYPSRRSVISSISQMERSSSQMRMLGMRAFSDQPRWHVGFSAQILRNRRLFCGLAQLQNKSATLAGFRAHEHLSFMRLHNLIHNRQTEAGSSFELRLER